MTPMITLDELRNEVVQRGYDMQVTETALHVAKQPFPQRVYKDFYPDFSLDQASARDYAILQAYYWVRGYHLTYGVQGKIILQDAMHHPAFDPKVWVEQIFDYNWDADWDIEKLHQSLLQWVTQREESDETLMRADEA